MSLQRRWLLFLLTAVFAISVACGGGSSDSEVNPTVQVGETDASSTEPTDAQPSPSTDASDSSGAPGASAVSLSQPTLPKRKLEFRVHVPSNHPVGDSVALMTMPPGNVATLERVQLEPDPSEPGVYFGTATVEEGALLRYTYDRWDGQNIDGWDSSRETVEDVYDFVNRYVLVTDQVDQVEDTVALWRDVPGPQHDGVVSGIVLDSSNGQPLMDATVSISGVHTATDWLGNFTVKNLPDGEHRAVVFTTLGDHRAQQIEFDISGGASDEVIFRLEPAAKVAVTFDVDLPHDMHPDAEIAIAGNLWQFGSRLYGYPLKPEAMALPVLNRSSDGRASATLDLYEGSYVNYTYTIRSIAEGADQSDSGTVFRSFIVEATTQTRVDQVVRWQNEGWPILTIRVTVPSNTTPGVPVGITTGPTAWLSQTGPFEWVAHRIHHPEATDGDRVWNNAG